MQVPSAGTSTPNWPSTKPCTLRLKVLGCCLSIAYPATHIHTSQERTAAQCSTAFSSQLAARESRRQGLFEAHWADSATPRRPASTAFCSWVRVMLSPPSLAPVAERRAGTGSRGSCFGTVSSILETSTCRHSALLRKLLRCGRESTVLG